MGDESFAASRFYESLRPTTYPVADDPGFVPITDQKPYLAGNVRYVLSLTQVFQLFSIALGSLVLCSAAVWWGLRHRGDPMIPGRPFPAVAGLAILIGANFLMIEHVLRAGLIPPDLCVRRCFDAGCDRVSDIVRVRKPSHWPKASAPTRDGGCGLRSRFSRRCSSDCQSAGVLIVVAPIALATGMFFPALFELAAANPLAVFAFDAVGAGLGAVAATFIPIAWGIDTFFVISGIVFIVTVIADTMFPLCSCDTLANGGPPPPGDQRTGDGLSRRSWSFARTLLPRRGQTR